MDLFSPTTITDALRFSSQYLDSGEIQSRNIRLSSCGEISRSKGKEGRGWGRGGEGGGGESKSEHSSPAILVVLSTRSIENSFSVSSPVSGGIKVKI